MRLTLALLFATLPLVAQVGVCSPPSVYAVVAGPQPNPAPPSAIYFTGSGIYPIPALAAVPWPLPSISIPATASPGQQVYIGINPNNSPNFLHVSAPFAVTCAPFPAIPQGPMLGGCYQDIFPAPAPGEYPVALYTVGFGVQPLWTGYPAIPTVTVQGCDANGYTVSYGPGTITVVCQ